MFTTNAIKSLIFAAGVSLLVGCSTFKGPGSIQTKSSVRPVPQIQEVSEVSQVHMHEDNEEHEDLSVVMNGPRRVSKPSSSLSFDWPVDEARMTRGFFTKEIARLKKKNRRRGHLGLDLANIKGTPILASESGVVVYAGSGFRGYGKLIVIEHNEEFATLYSHLNSFNVREGEVVEKGQVIGGMGRTGRASGVHLHFEIRYNRKPVNPLAYLPEIPGTERGSLALREE